MKRKYVIGNWKSNKNLSETENWFKSFQVLFSQNKNIQLGRVEIVVCVPFVFLSLAKKLRDEYRLPLKIGAQDVSPFANGAYTGEISATQLGEFVQYVIIGHSERRNNFREDDSLLSEKVKRANEAKLNSIYCVQDENTIIPAGVGIVAYEPVWAIGTGKTDTPENANRVAQTIKQKWNGEVLIYGGSVTADNIKSFITAESIDGVLPGGASLDAVKFWQMILNATAI